MGSPAAMMVEECWRCQLSCKYTQGTSRRSRVYLTDEADVRAFAERAAASSVLAVDTEFLREKTYYPRL